MASEQESEAEVSRRLAYYSHKSLLLVWRMVKMRIEPETQDNKYLAEAIRKHPEYQSELDALEEIGPEIEWPYPMDKTNPALHLAISALSRSLIENNKSAGIFYRRMKQKGISDHEIEHRVGMIFLGEYWLESRLAAKGKKLNHERINTLFRKYSRVSPEEFARKLDEEYRPWVD